eukprot:scaffold99857_cov27-Tisochrysis_lutea.AAC.2
MPPPQPERAMRAAYTCGVTPESHRTHLCTGVSAIRCCALATTHCANCCRSTAADGTAATWRSLADMRFNP